MKKSAFILLFSLFFSIFLVNSVEARSGCCSHHGGVCGCGCCDGTPLSATCAPYYPSCNSNPAKPKYIKEDSTIEEKVNNMPVYKTTTVIGGVRANNSNMVNSVVKSNQINNKDVREIVPLTKELEQISSLQDIVKTKNNIEIEQISLVSLDGSGINNNGNKFWGSLVFLGVVGCITYLVKKKEDKKNNN